MVTYAYILIHQAFLNIETLKAVIVTGENVVVVVTPQQFNLWSGRFGVEMKYKNSTLKNTFAVVKLLIYMSY